GRRVAKAAQKFHRSHEMPSGGNPTGRDKYRLPRNECNHNSESVPASPRDHPTLLDWPGGIHSVMGDIGAADPKRAIPHEAEHHYNSAGNRAIRRSRFGL
ncbi:MAG: hypothetical protein KF861_04890, partial [Planctomycetaceae bacterium]|nr:hypothetical protein [Planctomycetaceae bacterium]